jgi:hypothetical protein
LVVQREQTQVLSPKQKDIIVKSKLTRTFLAAGSAAALSIGLLTIVASPANAATSDCPSGSSCAWADATYVTGGHGNELLGFTKYIPDFSGWHYNLTSINANDTLTSVYDHTALSVYYYNNANQTGTEGPQFILSKSTGDGNVSNTSGYVQGVPDNTASSGYTSAYAPI